MLHPNCLRSACLFIARTRISHISRGSLTMVGGNLTIAAASPSARVAPTDKEASLKAVHVHRRLTRTLRVVVVLLACLVGVPAAAHGLVDRPVPVLVHACGTSAPSSRAAEEQPPTRVAPETRASGGGGEVRRACCPRRARETRPRDGTGTYLLHCSLLR